jgi:DNA-binding CsgD family transcriptional regulator
VSRRASAGAHERVAGIVEDPLDRARHAALATADPDPEIAATLESAATAATRRGAPMVAAELGEHALRLTQRDAYRDRHRRALALARAHFEAGEAPRARAVASDLLARAQRGPDRAAALVLLSELAETLDQRVALLVEALGEAVARPDLQARIHEQLAGSGRLTMGRQWAIEHARASLELAESLDDEALRVGALSTLGSLLFDVGDPEGPALVERAQAAAAASGDPDLLKVAAWGFMHVLMWSAQIARARAVLVARHRTWLGRDELVAADALWFLAWVELRADRWSLADQYAESVREANAQYGFEQAPQQYLPIALVAAHRGDLQRAREAGARGLALAKEQGALLAGLVALPGLVDLWAGDAAAAASHFADAEEMADADGWGEPNLRWWRAEHAEALLELGRVDDAVVLLDDWEAAATRVGRHWVLAQVTRCRGLVAAARAEVELAEALFHRAVQQHEAVGDPFGRARALLALGIVRRRARQKRAAREAIEEALAGFEQLAAATWVETARAELGRLGGRTRSEGLTPAERRVADLVAVGRTNREVAATLFLGERTVASHLTRIYAKLGVRSRTELARRLS